MTKFPFAPEILDAMPEGIAELYRGLELSLLHEIADRLTATGQLNEVTLQDIRALRSHGISLADIKKQIAKTAKISEDMLDKVLDDTVKWNERYYGELITFADLTLPEELVDAVTIDAIERQTKNELLNITRSMGFLVDAGRTMLPPAKAYQWALNNAEMQIQSGAIDYGTAIANATRQLSDSGLQYVDYESGWRNRVDVAVRRAVMTGVSQVSDKYTEQSAEYLGTKYYEISAHSGARDVQGPQGWESHKDWQGKVYYESIEGEPDPLGKYPDLVQSTGFGFVDGLEGANCRHRRFPWIEGISERTYTDDQLANIDPPPFKYEGQSYTHYEATQKQRQIETAVRHWKRRAAGATNDKDRQAAEIRVKRLNNKYEEFSKAAGLRMQKERMSVYDY